jgi:23S rRNA (adenine2503-C2)-methyltransferase
MGLTRVPDAVKHTQLLPLEDKWVITVSTQYGCSMGCTFCDVPNVGPGKNATFADLLGQVQTGLSLHPEVRQSNRLNIHYARMGEPTWNPAVLESAVWMHAVLNDKYHVHPVVSTMMPRHNSKLTEFIRKWMALKNNLYGGNAGLQLSINSTSELERASMFNNSAHTLPEIRDIMYGCIPAGRKITLNFALAGYEIDPNVLLKYFHCDDYIIKLTPMHKTAAALDKGIRTEGDYTTYTPYEDTEQKLVDAGYDVLVFIASQEEDESRITCGNAILADKENEDGEEED